MLCNTCQSIFEGDKHLTYSRVPLGGLGVRNIVEYPHYPNLKCVLMSARAGCHLCTLISDALDGNGRKISELTGSRLFGNEIQYRLEEAPSKFKHHYYLNMFSSTGWALDFALLPFSETECVRSNPRYPKEKFQNGRASLLSSEAFTTTNSESAWEVIWDWIEDCAASHKDCGDKYKSWWLPSRLVDVGFGPPTPFVRLCRSDFLSAGVKYATLSHCWGTKPALKLTSETLSAFQESIPISSLSNTFRDAIAVTRELNVRYIWIDSLCIMQDSILDWQHQSAEMGQIYANSFLNIAATSAVDGTGGCFQKRNSLLAQPCKVKATWKGEIIQGDEPSLLPGCYSCIPLFIMNQHVEKSPLCKRAWVLQERFLAPRTLHFGGTQLFWECNEHQAAEIYPKGTRLWTSGLKCLNPVRDGPWLRSSKLQRYNMKDHMLASLSEDPKTYHQICFYSLWDEIVSRYTRASLTVASDKLIALSGVAEEFQSMTGDEYVAGLWKQQLAHQLLWRVEGSSSRPAEPRAPSWSWASIEGEVYCACAIPRADEKDLLISKIEAHVTLATANPTGQVSAGVLRVMGRLNRISLQLKYNSVGVDSQDPYQDVGVAFDGPYSNYQLFPAFGRRDVPSDGMGHDLHCLPLRYIPGGGIFNIGYIDGLVLEPTGREAGEFKRFGVFTICTTRYDTAQDLFWMFEVTKGVDFELEYDDEPLVIPTTTSTMENSKDCVWRGRRYVISIV